MKPKIANTHLAQALRQKVSIEQVTWQGAENGLRAVRTLVFIDEQFVTPEFEWDEIDTDAVHLLATYEDQPIACLRIIEYQKIGRMAVIEQWRCMGIGAEMLQQAIAICRKQGSKYIKLSAQTHAIGFYKKAGFEQISDEYCDVDIPHVDMQLDI
jgi:predicted GNAT family N-acyltransferase